MQFSYTATEPVFFFTFFPASVVHNNFRLKATSSNNRFPMPNLEINLDEIFFNHQRYKKIIKINTKILHVRH